MTGKHQTLMIYTDMQLYMGNQGNHCTNILILFFFSWWLQFKERDTSTLFPFLIYACFILVNSSFNKRYSPIKTCETFFCSRLFSRRRLHQKIWLHKMLTCMCFRYRTSTNFYMSHNNCLQKCLQCVIRFTSIARAVYWDRY